MTGLVGRMDIAMMVWVLKRPGRTWRTQQRMRSIVADSKFVIAGHDPTVFDRFPTIAEHIVRIE